MTSTPHSASPRLTIAATALIGAMAAAGCANGPRLVTPDPPPIPDGGPPVPSANQVVLDPGTQVVADTTAGHIKIEAGPGTRRVFDWDGLRRGAIIRPRAEPFPGGDTKGIYFKGAPKLWKPAKGITKLRYEEGRRHFDNVDDAMIWMQIRRLYYTYNNNGLVVGWKREGDTLHVELWQFYIDGAMPSTLPDAQSTQITTGPLEAKPQKMYPRLVFADGHSERYTTDNADQYRGGGATSAGNSAGATNASKKSGWFEQNIGKPVSNLFGGGSGSSSSNDKNNTQGSSNDNAASP